MNKSEQILENVAIIKMSIEDISDVQAIEFEENLSPWTLDGYMAEIENVDSICLVAKIKNEIIGFLIARLIMSEYCIEVYNVAIKSKYKRKKIAGKLFNQVYKACKINGLKEIWLDVRKSNIAAISFYHKQGFREEYIRKSFYNNPVEDGIVMLNRIIY